MKPGDQNTKFVTITAILAGCLTLALAPVASANPQGMTVARGAATAATSGSRTTITASQNAFLSWQSFNIAPGQTTTFQQPSSISVVWNQINGAAPSQIWGNLNANGVVVLMNSSGFFFGPNSEVKAAGFVASTATVPPEFTGGSQWEFNGAPPVASIVNYGKIGVQPGGSLFLIGGEINNHGTLSAPGGSIGLAAAQQVLVSDRPDGHGLNIAVNLPAGSINNDGRIIANGGSILASAQTVNQNGLVQANSIREKDGVIELVAGDAVNLGADSIIDATGGAQAVSDGGQITIKSGNTFSDTTGSVISAAGGARGGNGGNVEISAPNIASLNSSLNATARSGYTAGRLLLDPDFILLDTSGTGSAGNGTVAAGNNPGTTLDLNVNKAFTGFSQITLDANKDITLVKNTAWNLSLSTKQTSGQLTLEAGRNIILQDNSSISDADNWSVTLKADSGSIYVNGGAGLANGGSIQTATGPIKLTAGRDIQTGNGSLTDVNGNPISLASTAGNITLNAGNNIQISGGTVETTGGGNINLTAATQDVNIDTGFVNATGGGAISATATLGSVTVGTGNIQTDSGSVTLNAAQNVSVISGFVSAGGNGNVNVTATSGAFTLGSSSSDISSGFIQTGDGSVTVKAGQYVELDGSIQTGSGSISLTAGSYILSGAGSLLDPNFNNFTLLSGADSTGSISLSSITGVQITSGLIETTSGAAISLATQQQDITVGSGAVVTTGGGNIDVTAQNGNVNTGSNPNGYTFARSSGAQASLASLGGISTGAGGNVTITAGQNVTSFAAENANTSEGGTGAFGAGDVKIMAGGDVTGHFIVTDGAGVIGTSLKPVGNAGTSHAQLALSLTDGSWSVNATHDIVLQEVRNPNGIFNQAGNFTTPTYHQFTYGADASLTLTANTVDILGGSLSKVRNSGEAGIPSIYPPELTINAGAGGILLNSDVILFPSPQGLLDINCAGPLIGASALKPTQLIMSDSGQNQFLNSASFGSSDHAAVPVHLNNPTLCQLTIGGDLDNISLVVPEAAQITVSGNMNNCAFLGQNLHPKDVTSIIVAGDIFNINDFSTVTLNLASVPDLQLLNQAYGTDFSELYGKLSYDSKTGTLAVQGQMTTDELNALFSFQIQTLNSLGRPATDANGQPLLQTVNLFDENNPSVKSALDLLQSESQSVPKSQGAGYALGGPGTFLITAHNLDLGDTQGVRSVGPGNNINLAPYCYNPGAPYDAGAAIDVTLTGNLSMFSTTISTLAGGAINVDAGGFINAGSTLVSPGDILPRGIFTVAKSDVSVTATGDINLDGSRIGAYDGGSVTVLSRTGNVDAGSGATGACQVQEIAVVPVINPLTGHTSYDVETFAPIIPGSGILATTFPGATDSHFPTSQNAVGNITVTTPQGNINASAGGVIQLPLNGVSANSATVTLDAGSPGFTGSIDASGSGVIGANVTLKATGNINGVVVAQNLNVTSLQNVTVTAVATGDANVSAGGTISGTIVGVGGISASAGSSIQASLLSQNVNASGTVSGQVGFAAANTAGATSQAASSDDRAAATAANDTTKTTDEDNQKKKRPVLARIGRVTVFLPGKSN